MMHSGTQGRISVYLLLIAGILFVSIGFLSPFSYAQSQVMEPPQRPVQGAIYVETANQSQINITSPSVGVVIQNEGGNITIGVLDPVPSPAPSVPIPPPNSVIEPTVAEAIPTNTQVIQQPPQASPIQNNPRLPEVPVIPTEVQNRFEPTSIPNPIFSPAPVIVNPVVNPTAFVEPTIPPSIPQVLPQPTPQPESTIPIIGPLIDIFSGIFNPQPSQPGGPIIVEPNQPEVLPEEPALVRVTPTPIPQEPSESANPIPIIGPIIDILSGIFNTGSQGPAQEPVVVDPATGEPQPAYVLVAPTPTPEPLPIIGPVLNAIIGFFGGNTSTASLTAEQQQVLQQNHVTSSSNEVRELFIRASNLISPNIAVALGLTPTSTNVAQQITVESETIVMNYLASYQLRIAADDEGNVVIQRGDASVKISVPVIMNPQNRSFSIMSEQGTIPVTYYPDTVKDELELNRVINSDLDMSLGLRDNNLVYVANGCEEEFLFAFLPVCPQKEVVLSARNLDIYEVRQSSVSRVVDLFAI